MKTGGHDECGRGRVKSGPGTANSLHEWVDVPPKPEVECQSRVHAKRVVEVPSLKIIVVALQSLHGAPCAVVRKTHQQVRKAVSGIRSQEVPVAHAVLPDMKTVVAV